LQPVHELLGVDGQVVLTDLIERVFEMLLDILRFAWVWNGWVSIVI